MKGLRLASTILGNLKGTIQDDLLSEPTPTVPLFDTSGSIRIPAARTHPYKTVTSLWLLDHRLPPLLSLSLSFPLQKPKIAVKHHPQFEADLGLSSWFGGVYVCVNVPQGHSYCSPVLWKQGWDDCILSFPALYLYLYRRLYPLTRSMHFLSCSPSMVASNTIYSNNEASGKHSNEQDSF